MQNIKEVLQFAVGYTVMLVASLLIIGIDKVFPRLARWILMLILSRIERHFPMEEID